MHDFKLTKLSQLFAIPHNNLDDTMILAHKSDLTTDDYLNESYKLAWETICNSGDYVDQLSKALVDMPLLSFFITKMTPNETNILLTTSCFFTQDVLLSLREKKNCISEKIVADYIDRVLEDCRLKYMKCKERSDLEYLLKRYISIMVKEPSKLNDYFKYGALTCETYYIVLGELGIMPDDDLPPSHIPINVRKIFIGSRCVQQDVWDHPDYVKYYPSTDHINDILCNAIRHLCWMITHFVPRKLTKEDLKLLRIKNIPLLSKYNDAEKIFKCPLHLARILSRFYWLSNDIKSLNSLQKNLRLPCNCRIPEHKMLELFFHDGKSEYKGIITNIDCCDIDYRLFTQIVHQHPHEAFIDWICIADNVTALKFSNIPIEKIIVGAYKYDSINILRYATQCIIDHYSKMTPKKIL
jgi:hypothetical protein